MHPLKIDHIIVGVNNLDTGIAQIKSLTGIEPIYGGVHTGGKTHNALIDLGDSIYLEIVSPTKGNSYEGLDQLTSLKTIGWAIRTSNIHKLETMLEIEQIRMSSPRTGGRKTPNGDKLDWTTMGLEQFGLDVFPFFIQWNTSAHPTSNAPGGISFQALEVETKNKIKMDSLLKLIQLDLQVVSSEDEKLNLVLDTPKGIVNI